MMATKTNRRNRLFRFGIGAYMGGVRFGQRIFAKLSQCPPSPADFLPLPDG